MIDFTDDLIVVEKNSEASRINHKRPKYSYLAVFCT